MNNKLKRILGVLLSFVLLFSSFGLNSAATVDESDKVDTDIIALNII